MTAPEPISIDQFLPIFIAREVKLELIDGCVVPFANGTREHMLVCERVIRALTSVAKPEGAVFTSQIALRRSDAPTYVFPDAPYTRETLEADSESIVARVSSSRSGRRSPSNATAVINSTFTKKSRRSKNTL